MRERDAPDFLMLKWKSAELHCGGLAELADADGSKSSDRKVMGVQVPRPLPSPSIPFLWRIGIFLRHWWVLARCRTAHRSGRSLFLQTYRQAGSVQVGFACVVVVDLGGEEFKDALRGLRRRL